MKTIFHKTYTNTSAINSGKFWHVPITRYDKDKYGAFNYIRIFNFNPFLIEIRFDTSDGDTEHVEYIVGNGTVEFERDIHRFYNISIKNPSNSTASVNSIRVEIKKVVE